MGPLLSSPIDECHVVKNTLLQTAFSAIRRCHFKLDRYLQKAGNAVRNAIFLDPHQILIERCYRINKQIFKSFFAKTELAHWAKSPKKQSEGVRFFVDSALKIQCHIVKKTLPLTVFRGFWPTGWPTLKGFK